MSWLDVADFLRSKRCFEARRTGSCNCGRGKRNACATATRMARSCVALDLNEPGEDGPEAILKVIVSKSCGLSKQGRECNHRGCMRSEHLAAWIRRFIGLYTQVA